MEPLLSAIVVTPGSCRDVAPILRRLGAQTIRERLEVVAVTPSLEAFAPDEALLGGFARWVAVPVGPLVSMAGARAAGIRAAGCEYVVFMETHCFPEDGWAEAIVAAFAAQDADAVGPMMGNANPKLALSWVNLCIEYGRWMAPQAGGLTDHLPGHNSAYRRDRLLEMGEALEAGVESEFAMHAAWHAQGRRLWLHPGARVFHVNMTDLSAHLQAACAFQRPWANSRAAEWAWARRLAYAAAWPLIAAVRLPRVIGDLRRAGQGHLLPQMLPAVVCGVVASAFGEFLGYLGSVGDAHALLLEVELYRERYLSPDDREARELFL